METKVIQMDAENPSLVRTILTYLHGQFKLLGIILGWCSQQGQHHILQVPLQSTLQSALQRLHGERECEACGQERSSYCRVIGYFAAGLLVGGFDFLSLVVAPLHQSLDDSVLVHTCKNLLLEGPEKLLSAGPLSVSTSACSRA